MVPGARRKGMRAVRAAFSVRRTGDDRRAFIVGLVAQRALAVRRLTRGPRPLEFRLVARRVVAFEPRGIGLDSTRDKVFAGFLEYGPAFRAVRADQRVAAPA